MLKIIDIIIFALLMSGLIETFGIFSNSLFDWGTFWLWFWLILIIMIIAFR